MKRRHAFQWPLVFAAVAFAIAPVAVRGGPSERDARHYRFFDRVSRFFSHFRLFRFDYPNSWYSERYDRYPDFGGNPNDYPYYVDPESGGRYPIDLAVEVQTELAQRGYYNGLIDGVIGPGSQTAIREFQAAAGLPVTGQIDDNLIEALRATDPGRACRGLLCRASYRLQLLCSARSSGGLLCSAFPIALTPCCSQAGHLSHGIVG